MKLLQLLVLVGSFFAVSGVQAGAVGDLTLTVDWNSLNISGVTMTQTSIMDPVDKISFTESTDGFLGYGNPFTGMDFSTPNGDSISRAHTGAEQHVSAAYDETLNHSVAHSGINKLPGSDLWGGAEVFHEIAYKAATTGSVTFEIAYSLTGSVSVVEEIGLSEYIRGDFFSTIEALDVGMFTDIYNNEFLNNGGDSDAAEDKAEADALVFLDNDEKVFELNNGCLVGDCTSSTNKNETLSLTFDVVAGKEYLFGAGGGVSTYSEVSSVPVPAAAWLFGTGLLGLFGVARRNRT